MNPFIDSTLTGVKKKGQHFLKGIDFEIKENKQQFIFHTSETGFTPTSITSFARLLCDMLIIHIGMISHGKVRQ